ncbi:hypothetical protein, partial [Methylobacterium nigriterrae]
SDLAARHRQMLMALSRDDKDKIWAFEEADGAGLLRAFDELLAAPAEGDAVPASGLMVQLRDYPEVFQTAFGEQIVRWPQSPATQLRIYG